MNITLSAAEDLVHKAREYAKDHNTSLNALIRDYLSEIADAGGREECAEEFVRLAETRGGNLEPGWRFNRDELYTGKRFGNA